MKIEVIRADELGHAPRVMLIFESDEERELFAKGPRLEPMMAGRRDEYGKLEAWRFELHHAPEGRTLEDVERAHVLSIVRETGGNKMRAAKILGIDRRTLYRMLHRFTERRAPPPVPNYGGFEEISHDSESDGCAGD